ncbi:peptide ABC transporter ATP-binding protein [Wenxinia marina]|uniref:dipeptide ABC transporter ATP-binding protein n=2 Tax=Wenxinia marina TaxID=390641 RepID=UPI0016684632|nr:ABC transporter ATP-binding protein [Wenxinia marina]GGL49893.1 peptide ABC transporter ATP-binding protein [Wenxinia marina]
MTLRPDAHPPMVEVDGLSIAFGALQVVHEIFFSIERGSSLAIVGESGSGKTVTARAISGLLGRKGGRITAGRVVVDGRDVANLDRTVWRQIWGRRMALVPQASLASLDPVLRIGTQMTETIRTVDPAADPATRAVELLDQVKLRDPARLMRAFPHELSGGMRQRVMIALALAGRPELIVADEPTTALDMTVQKAILRLLSDLRAETGLTLLMIAHDLAVVSEVADEVAVMREGRLVEVGPARRILTAPTHPYTRALLAAQPHEADRGRPLAVLDRTTGDLHRPTLPPAPPLREDVPVLMAEAASIVYPGASAPALQPVDLAISRGSSLGIVGESGSGKSTLGKLLVGATLPTSGRVSVLGAEWSAIGRRDPRRRKVQMIFQDPYGSLTPWRTPRKIVAEVLRCWTPMRWSDALDQAGQLLTEVGLPDACKDQMPATLSGGQCQRVGIARALAADPEILVADEPTSSLDISTQAQILNLMLRLRQERGLALVLISHDLQIVRHMTDTALVIQNGIVVERGACADILTSPQHRYTRELIASTPRMPTVAA